MATVTEWVEGARLRTLFLSVAPVVAGTGVAAHDGGVRWVRALLALIVALGMQIGVNYANDYSDGIRGTDAERVGPMRLVGSGAASPAAVRTAALLSFAVAAAAGTVLAALTTWWLVAVGAAAIAAAWTYTGGPIAYGYRALGEIAVFAFFGLVAVIGTAYVQAGYVSGTAWAIAIPLGLLACAVLVANNLRDIPGDVGAGKRTLAVLFGDANTRRFYLLLVAAAYVVVVLAAIGIGPWLLITLAAVPLAVLVTLPVLHDAHGPALIPTLKGTGQLALLTACLLAAGLVLTSR